MAEYIERAALYNKIAALEELARNRYLDTPGSNPAYPRYHAQLNERTALKHLVADFPAAADVASVRHGRWEHDHYEDCTEQFEIVKCSNCGYSAYAMALFVKSGNYCPNCGAKMDG